MSDTRILFGFHAVLSRLRQHAASVQEILIDRDRVDARMKDLLSMAESAGVRLMQVERSRLDGLAGVHGRHQGVIARVIDTPIPVQGYPRHSRIRSQGAAAFSDSGRCGRPARTSAPVCAWPMPSGVHAVTRAQGQGGRA